jgi:uncharacterized membrane protein
MINTKPLIKSLIIDLFFLFTLWAGFIQNIEVWHFVALFIAWFSIFGTFTTFLIPKEQQIQIAKKNNLLLFKFILIFDLSIAIFMLWRQIPITGIFYGIAGIILYSFQHKCLLALTAEELES